MSKNDRYTAPIDSVAKNAALFAVMLAEQALREGEGVDWREIAKEAILAAGALQTELIESHLQRLEKQREEAPR